MAMTTRQIEDDLNGVIESTMKRLGKDITEGWCEQRQRILDG